MSPWRMLLLLALRLQQRSPEPRAREIGEAGVALKAILDELARGVAAGFRDRDLADDLAMALWEKVWTRPEPFLNPLHLASSERSLLATAEGIETLLAIGDDRASELDERSDVVRGYFHTSLSRIQLDHVRREKRRTDLRTTKDPASAEDAPAARGTELQGDRVDLGRADAVIARAAEGVAGWHIFAACSDGRQSIEALVRAELAESGETVDAGDAASRHPSWKKVRARIDKRNQRIRDAVHANIDALERAKQVSPEEAELARARIRAMLLVQRPARVRSAAPDASSGEGNRQ